MNQIEKKFKAMGAEVEVSEWTLPRGFVRRPSERRPGVRVDVRRGVFDILTRGDVKLAVVDVRPEDRHLLLHVDAGGVKSKYLCGHDERDWFVAAVPEGRSVRSVIDAKMALKPAAVHEAEQKAGVKPRKKNRRENKGSIRQGEWFFIPSPDIEVDPLLILKNEPLVRAGRQGRMGKPHYAEEAYRVGGQTVYVCSRYPSGITESAYRRLIQDHPDDRKLNWRVMRRNPTLYIRGRITHPDHATKILRGWHRVAQNTEFQAAAMESLAFLD